MLNLAFSGCDQRGAKLVDTQRASRSKPFFSLAFR